MTTSYNPHEVPTTRWLDRALWIVTALLIVATAGFAGFYYWDRYHPRGESLLDRETQHLERMIRENPENPALRVAIAQRYFVQGMLDLAIQQAQEALKLDSASEEALILLGKAYTLKGEIEQAITHYTKVVELNQDNEFAGINRRLETAYYELGELYLQRGDLARAQEAFASALAIDRTDADARYGLGLAYQRAGEHAKAVEQFREATRFVPNFTEAYQGMATS